MSLGSGAICSGVIICVILATKFRSMDAQVLFRSFRAKTTQSTTAITSIVICVANQLRIECESVNFRHCEANRRFAQSNPQIKQNRLPRFCCTKSRNDSVGRIVESKIKSI